jgi:hypothetical protein
VLHEGNLLGGGGRQECALHWYELNVIRAAKLGVVKLEYVNKYIIQLFCDVRDKCDNFFCKTTNTQDELRKPKP